MTLLNQIIAIEKGVKAEATKEETELYRLVQKPALLTGISRVYRPKDEDGDQLPTELSPPQVAIETVFPALQTALTRLFDVTLTKEVANASARADIEVDGMVLLADVPVTYLLFLDKELTKLAAFVEKLPILDPSSVWELDVNTGIYRSAPTETTRTKKERRHDVLSPATDKHPAQVEVYHEDVIVGYWTKVDFSGAIPAVRKMELVNRVATLQHAVKFARERANSAEIVDKHGAAAAVFNYLFAR